MNQPPLLIVALVVLPALGLAFWAGCVMEQVEQELADRMGWKRVPSDDPTAPHDPREGPT